MLWGTTHVEMKKRQGEKFFFFFKIGEDAISRVYAISTI